MIESSQQQKLRTVFNPDGSSLRNYQLVLLDLLRAFDAICREYDIEYWLSAGNVLGAVRHGGFIPWDDDIDIEMTIDNYRKFESVFVENDDYAIQSHKTDPYYALNTPKFRDKRTCLNEIGSSAEWQKYNGAFIDIFIMEDTFATVSHFLAWGAYMQHWVYAKRKFFGLMAKPLSRLLNFGTHMLIPVVRGVGKCFPGKKFRFCYGSSFHSTVRCKKEIFPLSTVGFEGYEFPAPGNTDAYLRRIYGDYNKLPDMNDLPRHFDNYD